MNVKACLHTAFLESSTQDHSSIIHSCKAQRSRPNRCSSSRQRSSSSMAAIPLYMFSSASHQAGVELI